MIDQVYYESNETPGSEISVHAGFPNAGNDAQRQALNLNQLLVPHPVSTFLFRISGNDWARYGVFDGDITVIDRALMPGTTDLVIWWHESSGEFRLSRRKTIPAQATVWGCVTSIIHPAKRGKA